MFKEQIRETFCVKNFDYFHIHLLKHVLGAQKNYLIEMMLLSIQNVCFG